MTVRWGLLAIALGVLLRVMAFDAHSLPRGDVVLDVGVARSLGNGEGFHAGFERALPKLAGARAEVGPQDLADQHPPLWPLLASPLVWLGLDAFTALKLLSFLFGLAAIWLSWRVTDRLIEGFAGAPDGLPALAAGCVGVGFLAVESSGNGSLYAAQAVGVLALVELLAAPRPSALWLGLVLGMLQLLNHQCAVLLPVPLLVLWLAAPRGGRLRAAAVGLGSVAVAMLCLAPWWMRNASAFGNPFHSVNSIYFLYRAGVDVAFDVEQGVPVLRFAESLSVPLLLRASLGFAKPNALYVLSTGLAVWPVLLGVAAAMFVPFVVSAWEGRDRRLWAVLSCLVVLAAVTVMWPATKLRYLVVLQPLVVVLAVRAFAMVCVADNPSNSRRRRWESWGALAVGLVWLAALLLTRDDISGDPAAGARPLRWMTLAFGGALLLWLPLRLLGRAIRRGAAKGGAVSGDGLPRTLLLAAVCVSWVLSSWVAVGGDMRTAYHSTDFAPDVFGKHGEAGEARDMEALAAVRQEALRANVVELVGPVGLLAWPEPSLLEVSKGLSGDLLVRTLVALAEADRLEWLALLMADAQVLVGPFPEVGQEAFGGRLKVVAVISESETCSGAVLLVRIR